MSAPEQVVFNPISMKIMKRQLIVTTLGVFLVACANVRPGDRDYPARNPSANQLIQTTILVPNGWLISNVIARFDPKDGGIYNPMTGGLVCGYMVGPGASVPYHVDASLSLTQQGTIYTFIIPADQFLDGRCGWHIAAVEAKLQRNVGAPDAYIAFTRGMYDPYTPPHATSWVTDLWCFDGAFGNHALDCRTELDPENRISDIPPFKRGESRIPAIVPSLKEIKITLHDLYAEAAIERTKDTKEKNEQPDL